MSPFKYYHLNAHKIAIFSKHKSLCQPDTWESSQITLKVWSFRVVSNHWTGLLDGILEWTTGLIFLVLHIFRGGITVLFDNSSALSGEYDT